MACSRLGKAKVVFAPYKSDQIEAIVKDRLAGLPQVFDNFAIRLAARKIATVSGDVRRALEVLRQAAEIWEHEKGTKEHGAELVKADTVSRAYAAMFDAAHMQVRLRSLPHVQLQGLLCIIFVLSHSIALFQSKTSRV